jgi:tetratricopeptide (TPR) repeat protein
LEAFKKGGGEARAYNNLGCIYLRQGKFEEAIHLFEKAIEIEPGFYARASENLNKAKAGKGQL